MNRFAALLLLAGPAPLAAQAVTYQPVFDSARAITLRTDSAGAVSGVVLTRDAIRYRLDSGTVFVATPIGGRTVALVFQGRGSASVTPPLDVERRELARTLHDTLTSWPITGAAFVFTDSTWGELRREVDWIKAPELGDAPRVLAHLIDHLVNTREEALYEPDLMLNLLNGDTTGFVLARVTRESGSDLTFRYDVQATEAEAVEVDPHEGGGERILSEFPLARYLADSEPEMGAGHELAMGPYSITSTIDDGHRYSATAVVRFTPRKRGARWVQFSLESDLQVDSLGEDGGDAEPFFRPAHGPALWIRLNEVTRPGGVRAVRIGYHGDLIGTTSLIQTYRSYGFLQKYNGMPDQWLYLKSCTDWYPRYDYWQPTDMDLTFRVASRYQFAGIGHLVDSTRSGDTVITHWRTERPTVWACFNIGELQEQHINDPRIPPVVVQTNHEAHSALDPLMMQQEGALQNVTADVTNSLAFFSLHFGTPLYPRYFATEVPFNFGVAFPGMVYLSNYTYQSLTASGVQEMFRSHEIAHQWWGIGVMPAGTRDAWLQEGFAEFSALWYMQVALEDTAKFFDRLKTWRDRLVKRGPDAPPLGLGFRVQESDHPGDYDLIVYSKGAWVLQMLRNFMLDLRNMNEGAFAETMRDFYARFHGRKASIRDFQRVVEEHVGNSMDWFFDEWVNRSAIPTYTFSWKADTAVNGRIPVHLRVRQADVPADFFMPVPVEIDFGAGSHVLVRINARGPVTDGTIYAPEPPT
ncbi:MAG TPA: M1 family aminopeptidase, partial [Gemmatimonadales bacterium]|nr:M1 family aminopeptidase [Gemmatimonadales bacterium]